MRRLLSIVAALAVAAGMSLAVVPASSAAPKDFQIVLDDPTQVMMSGVAQSDEVSPLCATSEGGAKQPLESVMTSVVPLAMMGQTVTLYCDLSVASKITSAAFGGKAFADFGSGQVEGTLAPTCNVDVSLLGSMKLVVKAVGTSVSVTMDSQSFSGTVSGTTECAFTLTFPTNASTLVGTITGTLNSSSTGASATCPDTAKTQMIQMLPAQLASVKSDVYWDAFCMSVDLAMNVTATGGTGQFLSNSGSGVYNLPLPVPFFMLNDAGMAKMSSGFGPPIGLRTAVRTVPAAGVRSDASMSLNLAKTGTAISLVIPKSGKAYLLGKAADGSNLTVVISTAPTAKVSVKGVYKGKSVVVKKATKTASGVFDTKLTSKTLQKKLGAKKGTTITLKITSAVSGASKVTKSFKVKLG